jgi:hypothetical protein
MKLRLAVLFAAATFSSCYRAHTQDAVASTLQYQAPANGAPLFAVLTKADWCSICKTNGARVTALVMSEVKNGRYELVVNDITSDASTEKSRPDIDSRGLAEVASGASPGTITFVDPRTRLRVAEATVAHQDEEIVALTKLATSKLSK